MLVRGLLAQGDEHCVRRQSSYLWQFVAFCLLILGSILSFLESGHGAFLVCVCLLLFVFGFVFICFLFLFLFLFLLFVKMEMGIRIKIKIKIKTKNRRSGSCMRPVN